MRAEAGFGTMIFRAAWDKIQSIIGNVMDYDRVRARTDRQRLARP